MSLPEVPNLSDTIATIIAQSGQSDSLAQRIAEIVLPAISRYITVAQDERMAYDKDTLASLVCLGRTTIDEAVKRGDLIAVYPAKKKPIVTREEALRWLATLPTEPQS